MTKPMAPQHGHWDADSMASVVDGHAGAAEKQRLAGHLGQCGRCMAVYADLVEMRLAAVTDPTVSNPGAEWQELAMRVAAAPAGFSRARRPGRPAWIPATAAAAVLGLTLAFLFYSRSNRSPSPLIREAKAALERQLQVGGPNGLLYVPELPPATTGLRGSATAPPLILKELARERTSGRPDPEVDFWLIAGNLATGQEQMAGDILDEALRQYPDDPRFQNLAAISAVRRGDRGAAEQHLRSAVKHDPSHLADYNLALLLRDQGRRAEAKELLEQVRTSSPYPELVSRAASLLTE